MSLVVIPMPPARHSASKRQIDKNVLILQNRLVFVVENSMLVLADALQKKPVKHFVRIQITTKSVRNTPLPLVGIFRVLVGVIARHHAVPIANKIHRNAGNLGHRRVAQAIILKRYAVKHQIALGQIMLVRVRETLEAETMKNSAKKIRISVREV